MADPTVVFELTPADVDEVHREAFPYEWRLRFTVTLLEDSDELVAQLEILNEGKVAFPCQALLHPYFLIEDISKSSIVGLGGFRYLSAKETVKCSNSLDSREAIVVDGETDRLYYDAPRQVWLRTPTSVIRVARQGVPDSGADCTIWNPWEEKSRKMNDLGNEEYQRFVCIEHCVGRVPITVPPSGGSWTFSQKFSCTDIR
jgi:glucose-6-phosphate 1-epimerase